MSTYQKKFLEQLVLRNYTEKTVTGYKENLDKFLKFFKGLTPSQLTIEHVNAYKLHLISKGQAPSYINGQTGSFKFFCDKVLKKDWDFDDIPYMKIPKRLPFVQEREVVDKILRCSTSPTVRLALGIAYGSGVRPFENAMIMPQDIDRKSGTLNVPNGKGRKERVTVFPPELNDDLEKQLSLASRQKSLWLFPGLNPEKHIDPESISTMYRRVKYALKIDDPSNLYTQRHNFATHLYEDGVDVLTLQYLLGHGSVDMVMKYVLVSKIRVSKVTSPLSTLSKQRS